MTADTIEVALNGRTAVLPSGITVAHMLRERELPLELVAVEYNGRILRREEFAEIVIVAGDRLEVVHFVGGGRGPDGDAE